MIRPSKPNSLRNNSVTIRRDTVAGVGFSLEAWVPPVADHHAVTPLVGAFRCPDVVTAPTRIAKHGQFIPIKFFAGAIDPGQLDNEHLKLRPSNRENVCRSWRSPALSSLH